MNAMQVQDPSPTNIAIERLHSRRALVAGVGNIGSYLVALLAPAVGSIRIVDHDVVQSHNVLNQFYGPEHEGRLKVDVTADRIGQLAPQVQVERRACRIEDLPLEDLADVDFAVAGFDTLAARQYLAEKLYTLRIPYFDGAVGNPLDVRAQVFVPGQACLECSWGDAQYRQLTTEYPCHAGGSAEGPPSMTPACGGAASAALLVAQCVKFFGDESPQDSYEINGDLLANRFVTSRRRRNEKCRFGHEVVTQLIRLEAAFPVATIADLLAAVRKNFRAQPVQLEFRRGILADDLFGASQRATAEQLEPMRQRRLSEMGLTTRDRIVARVSGQTRMAHICFDANYGDDHE